MMQSKVVFEMGKATIDEIPEEAIDIVARHTNYSKMTGG
jgi:hypothetical protein